jgi:hypothetical protein
MSSFMLNVAVPDDSLILITPIRFAMRRVNHLG